MFSSQFGVERDAYLKEDIDNFPIIPFEDLTKEQIEEIQKLSDQFIHSPDTIDWKGVDSFVYKLYGLNKWDIQVIEDTLEMNLPFSANKKYSQKSPNKICINQFLSSLKENLKPFFEVMDNELYVDHINEFSNSPWIFFSVSTEKVQFIIDSILRDISKLADQSASSQIIIKQKNRLVIGILKQNRYWTKTRARILAKKILFEYEDVFVGGLE